MNSQERDQLQVFLQQLIAIPAVQKDPEADVLIRDACMRQADAGYLLVQRAMQLSHVLEVSQAEAGRLRAELEQIRQGTPTSFVGNANAWGKAGVASPVAHAPVMASSAPVMQAPIQPAAAPAMASPSWGSGMLGSVATTAAGVVAGSFLFQGIENLMGHHGSALGASNPPAAPLAQNTVTNNYFGNSDDLADDGTDIADSSGDIDDSGDVG